MISPTQTSSGELTRADVEERLLSKSLQDQAFAEVLVADPQTVWRQEFGDTALQDIQLVVFQETKDTLYLIIPAQEQSLRQELAKQPKTVWQRELGKSRFNGYTIRVLEEPIGQFYLVLPLIERTSDLEKALSQSMVANAHSHATSPDLKQHSSNLTKTLRSLGQHRMPRTKLGRILAILRSWGVMLFLSNPIVIALTRPIYWVISLFYAWKRI
ncbi:hypothetical protein ACN4EK_10005 [Pantanalinema rosaneae CENA516]|uniref:hypothetical protein n=1 Tax=Pantanalinema rosaneae TaxID=1620701 RepID=UPI003D6E1F30